MLTAIVLIKDAIFNDPWLHSKSPERYKKVLKVYTPNITPNQDNGHEKKLR